MGFGPKRLSLRARRITRHLARTKNIALQRMHLHELHHAIARKHGVRGPKKAPDPGTPGMYQRLSRRARHLLRRLRGPQEWAPRRRTITELGHEVERGARIAAARDARRARAEARREARAQRRVGQRARGEAPGQRFRGWVRRIQEPMIKRAERRAAARPAAGTRAPSPRTRQGRYGRNLARRVLPTLQLWAHSRTSSPARPASGRPASRPAPARVTRTPRTPRAARAPRTPRLRPVRAGRSR
jgi:hypothetical protein